MRICELTVNPLAHHYIRAKDIHVGQNKDKILMILYSSKTHGKESRPQQIKIHAVPTTTHRIKHFCPFKMVRRYMKIRGEYDYSEEPLFIWRDGSQVSSQQVRKTLRECLQNLGPDAQLYDTHSFRIGMASDMMKQNFSISQIRQKGRWRINMVFKYLRNL